MVVLFVAGVALRTFAAMTREAAPDAVIYARHAAEMSWLHPWAASEREPLWVLANKLVIAPFGYRVGALQVMSWALSVVALWVCWRLVRRLGSGSVVALAVLALHPLLIDDAAMGLREPATLILCALIAGWLLDGRWVAGLGIGVMLGVRWELGLLWLGVTVVAIAVRQARVRVVLAALAVGVVVMGPFFVANRATFGDPMHHSNLHAVYYRNIEDAERAGQDAYSLPRYRGEPITWADYYLHYVGPRKAAERIGEGMAKVPSTVAGFDHFEVGVVVLALAVATALLERSKIAVGALLVIAAGSAGYAGISRVLPYRLVSFLVLPMAVLLGLAWERLAGAGGLDDLHDRAAADASIEHGDVAEVP